MESIKGILSQLNRKFLNGAKIPHGMSNPVIREHDGRYVIATFFYLYNREHLAAKQIPRPGYWMIAEVESGEMIQEVSCKDNDFSKQPFDELYSTERLDSWKSDADYTEKMFMMFEDVRLSLIESNSLNKDKYDEYMKMVLAMVPVSYHVFYRELSGVE